VTRARRPLRVCMVHYSDFHIDSRIQRQARALAERGDEVDLVCLSPPGEVRVGAGVIRVHSVPLAKAAGGTSSYLSGYGRFFLGALRKVTALERTRRFDVVEAHNMPDMLTFCGLAPKLRGAKVILNVHDTFPELFATRFERAGSHPAVRLVTIQERVSAAFADSVICVTSEAGDRLNDRGVGSGRTTIVMNTPDERVFGPQRPPVAWPAEGPLRAIYHGGLAPRFGVELLIDAVGSLEDGAARVALRVCGTGSEQARLSARADEVAPGRVDIAPEPVPFARIPGELEAAHIGVVPTLRDPFTELLLPVKLLEYVHMGLPAIAPRLPVIERYFSDDEVRFFEPDSAASLAQAIAAVCADPAAAHARAERAAVRLADLAWQHQRERYLALMDELAGSRPAQAGPARHRRSMREAAGTV
jgi:glycosyltransferase involved in cell wall biosynthesis